MERVIVEIFLPATGQEFDVRIPLDLNVKVLSDMISKALSTLSYSGYLPSRSSCLAWRKTGLLLDPSKTMRQCGVKNTSKLLII